ncbi:MAG: hypothetical protein NVS9B15_23610 [Acidobacteriaceae bacterium]
MIEARIVSRAIWTLPAAGLLLGAPWLRPWFADPADLAGTGMTIPVLLVLSAVSQSHGIGGRIQRICIGVGWAWIVLLAIRLFLYAAISLSYGGYISHSF